MIQKISILGCGWLGLALAKSLIAQGKIVKGSTTSSSNLPLFQKQGIQSFLLDLKTRNQDWSKFLQTDVLVIAIPSKKYGDFKYLVQQIEAHKVKKVVFISSTSVYASNNAMVTEESELLPTDLVNIENLFRNNTHFQTTIIRFAGLYGYNRKPGLFLKDDKPLKNPMGFINLIHRDDCIGVIEKILSLEVWGEIFNACSHSHPNRLDFYTQEMKREGRVAPSYEKNSDESYKIISSQKLQQKLGYKFKHTDLMDL